MNNNFINILNNFTNGRIVGLDGNGAVKYLSSSLQKTFECTDSQIGQPFINLLLPSSHQNFENIITEMRQAFENGVNIDKTLDLVGKRGNDETNCFAFQLKIMTYNCENVSDMCFIGMVKELFDETDSNEMATKYRGIVEAAIDGIISIDQYGIITTFNRGAENIFGYKSNQIIGHNVSMLMPEPYRSYHDKYIQSYRETRKAHIIGIGREVEGVRSDGTTIQLFLSIAELEDNSFIGIVRDITDIKKAQKITYERTIQDLSEAKYNFIANMSHEIRTPLNGIIGMADIMKMNIDSNTKCDSDNILSSINTITQCGNQLLDIINSILDYSRLEANQLKIYEEPFDLRECIEMAHDTISHAAHAKGIEISYIFDKDVPLSLFGDSRRIKQILINLLSNAVKFTERGYIFTKISCQHCGESPRSKSDQYNINFNVTDTGIGISADKADQIFDTFTQLDNNLNRGYNGSGLGLSISRKIARLMNGDITVQSFEGIGSTFTLQVKLRSHFNLKSTSTQYGSGEINILKNKKVLLIDDNEINLLVVSNLCMNWGMIPIQCTSPESALLYIKNQNFDIILMDICMPNKNGLELLEDIQRISQVNVVAISSLDKNREMHQKFEYFLNKPIKQDLLFKTMVKCLLNNSKGTDIVRQTRQASKKISRSKKKHRRKHRSKKPKPHLKRCTSEIVQVEDVQQFRKILVAEDDANNIKVMQIYLQKLGYENSQIEFAKNGVDVIKLIKKHPTRFGLILMDIKMPNLDGYQTSRIIRERHPNADIKIIAVTASAMPGDQDKCIAAGMDDYLPKPVSLPDLKRVIDKNFATCPVGECDQQSQL